MLNKTDKLAFLIASWWIELEKGFLMGLGACLAVKLMLL